jgi:16S rRNA (adenine1518-N6/adenine1519-N6)-dimethyltransferase
MPRTFDAGPRRHQPRKRFGQHFLAPAWSAKLLAAIDPRPDQTFLEIGPGEGAITRGLASRAARVVAVEVDRDLAARLRAAAIARLTVVEADILEVDLAGLGLPRGTRLAGNLPYNISSPILFRVLDAQRRAGLFADATFMLQKEVADRLVAPPGTKDYGLLTIFTALEARVVRQLTLPPGAFHPPPKVTSAVVRLTFLPESDRPLVPGPFPAMVRALFATRRKTIANGLKGPAAAAGTAPADVLTRAGLDPCLRPEQLTLAQLLALAAALERPDRRHDP